MPLRTAADLKEGDVLAGKYRVERVIGVGGMGVVTAALHLELGTLVAIKLLLCDAAATDEAIERFSREARAASRLRGEHAVRVFDVGKHSDGTPYMVMEYLVGEDLESLLTAKGPLAITTAVGFVLQACEAIAEAHSIGIVHRDLKPTNLFLTRRLDGSPLVKVLDFGIAKRVEPETGRSLTGTLAVGSPPYMSPEQLRGSTTVDSRSDIWSLGVCLYELVTGVLPFGGNSALEICTSVLRDLPRPPSELRKDVPAGLTQVVMRCLHKDQAERFSDVGVLAEALEPFALPSDRGGASRMRHVLRTLGVAGGQVSSDPVSLHGAAREPAPAGEEPSRRGRRVRGAIAVATLGAIAATAVWMARRANVERAETRPGAAVALEAPRAPTVDSSALVRQLRPPASLEALSAGHEVTGPGHLEPASRARHAGPPGAGTASHARPLAVTAASNPERAPDPLVPVPVAPIAPSAVPSASSPASLPAAPLVVAAPPAFVIESAQVQIGVPTGVVGTTASNVRRALGKIGSRMTTCYRAALPRMSAPVDGAATLHVATDEEGVITDAELAGPLAVGLGACIAAAARGLTISNVDTGRARADVPLLFRAR